MANCINAHKRTVIDLYLHIAVGNAFLHPLPATIPGTEPNSYDTSGP